MTLVLFILFAAILGSFLASFIYRYVNKNIEKDAFVQSINIYTCLLYTSDAADE